MWRAASLKEWNSIEMHRCSPELWLHTRKSFIRSLLSGTFAAATTGMLTHYFSSVTFSCLLPTIYHTTVPPVENKKKGKLLDATLSCKLKISLEKQKMQSAQEQNKLIYVFVSIMPQKKKPKQTQNHPNKQTPTKNRKKKRKNKTPKEPPKNNQ